MGDTIKRGNFKQAADFLLLAAPVQTNDMSYNEHLVSAANDEGSKDNKQDSGYNGFKKVDNVSSGVELWYYYFKEYKKLLEDQR